MVGQVVQFSSEWKFLDLQDKVPPLGPLRVNRASARVSDNVIVPRREVSKAQKYEASEVIQCELITKVENERDIWTMIVKCRGLR